MSPELLLIVLFALVCLIPIGIQQRRLRRLQSAWEAIAGRQGWVFIEARGMWYNRSEFRLGVPSPAGGIDISWSPGYRGSPKTTVVKRRIPGDDRVSIQLLEKLDPEKLLAPVETGDADYERLFRATASDPGWLAGRMDAEWRRMHSELAVEIFVEDGFFWLVAPGFVDDEDELLRLVALSERFMARPAQKSIE